MTVQDGERGTAVTCNRTFVLASKQKFSKSRNTSQTRSVQLIILRLPWSGKNGL